MTAAIAAASASITLRDADVGATLACYQHGPGDPTTWLETTGRGPRAGGRFVRATWTPDGPATLSLRWAGDGSIDTESFGPGAAWLARQAPAMVGATDPEHLLEAAEHPVVAAAARANRHLRIGASGDLYHELLPFVIEQRITAVEAHRQWQRLCIDLGEPAPGPFARLLLPPAPDVLARQPSWWFHPRGIERKRAEPLIEIGRHAAKFWAWATAGPDEAARKLALLRGVGPWTIGSVLGPALGDPDAVPVGDFHFKNVISHQLAGRARGTDEQMLELLAPYAGQRGRVLRHVVRHGGAAPKFGPKQRILPMHAW